MRISSLLLAFLVAACSQINFAVVNLPTHFDNIDVTRDVSFGPDSWQKLDIYVPHGIDRSKKLPVIVFYYGGRWTDGSRTGYGFIGSVLAKENFVVVIPDYRKFPDVKFPEFVQDGAQSLSWVYDHIADYGGDPESIHIAGHSAGAHIAALLAADPEYLKAEGKDRSHVIQDFVGLAGPYAFTPEAEDLKNIFGPPEKYPQMRVPNFIDGKQPPMLLLWGEDDTDVGRFNMEKLSAAVHENGGCVVEKTYPGMDHVWILARLSWLGMKKQSVLNDWIEFIKNDQCPQQKMNGNKK